MIRLIVSSISSEIAKEPPIHISSILLETIPLQRTENNTKVVKPSNHFTRGRCLGLNVLEPLSFALGLECHSEEEEDLLRYLSSLTSLLSYP